MKQTIIIVLMVLLGIALYSKITRSPETEALVPVEQVQPVPETPQLPISPPLPEMRPEVPQEFTIYKDALAASQASKKSMFLYFGAEWCVPCKRMKSSTLVDPAVKEKLANFVVCIIDTDKDRPTTRKFRVTTLPTYMVLSSDEKVIQKTEGFKYKEEFLNWLNLLN